MLNDKKINLWAKWVLLICCYTFSYASESENKPTFTPRPFVAQYTITKSGFNIGIATISLTREANDLWRYHSIAKPKGLAKLITRDKIIEEAYVKITDQRITPMQYSSQNERKQTDLHIDYDWDNNIARRTQNDQGSTIPLTYDHLDRSALVVALMRDSALNITHAKYLVIDDSMKQRNYQRRSETLIKTKPGTYKAFQVIQTSDSKRKLHYWFAPELNHIPIRIEQFRKQKTQFEMLLDSIEWLE